MIDLIVRGGTMVDGSGAPARRTDIGVDGGRIVAIGEVTSEARHIVDSTASRATLR